MARGTRYNPYVTPRTQRRGRARALKFKSSSSSSSGNSYIAIANRIARAVAPKAGASKVKTRTNKHYAVSKRPWVDTHGKRPIRTSKKRVLNPALKGGMAKFKKKVMKVMQHVNNYGEYIYISTQQLKQGVMDRYGLFPVDSQGIPITIGSDRALADAAACLYNAKASVKDYNVVTGNFGGNNQINLISERLEFFFKSTSSHVVNIQMFEFISKTDQELSGADLIAESLDDYTNSLKATNDVAQTGPFGFDMPGTEARHLTSAFPKYSIKVHYFKLPPGETASKSFVRGSRTYDPIKSKNAAEQPWAYRKGCSYFYFRVLNDITVSGISVGNFDLTASQVHNWPSNRQGGVAMEYKRIIRVMPPPNTASASDRPAIVIGCMKDPASIIFSDQQVVVYNPESKASAD